MATIQSLVTLLKISLLSVSLMFSHNFVVIAEEPVPVENISTKDFSTIDIKGRNLTYTFSNPRTTDEYFVLDMKVDNKSDDSFVIFYQLGFDLMMQSQIDQETTEEIYPIVFMSEPKFEDREFLQAETAIEANEEVDHLSLAFNLDDLKDRTELIIETDLLFVKNEDAIIYRIQLDEAMTQGKQIDQPEEQKSTQPAGKKTNQKTNTNQTLEKLFDDHSNEEEP